METFTVLFTYYNNTTFEFFKRESNFFHLPNAIKFAKKLRRCVDTMPCIDIINDETGEVMWYADETGEYECGCHE